MQSTGKHTHSLGPALDNQHALLPVTPPLDNLYTAPNPSLGSLPQVLSGTVPLREMTGESLRRSLRRAARELLTQETSGRHCLYQYRRSQEPQLQTPPPTSRLPPADRARVGRSHELGAGAAGRPTAQSLAVIGVDIYNG